MISRGIVQALKNLHARSPIAVNTASLCILYAAADISQQTIKRTPEYNFKNAARMAGAAAYGGPFYHFWYKLLDGRFPGTSLKVVVKKLFYDQAVAGVIGTAIFYTVLSVLEGKEDIFQQALVKGPPTFLTGCVYWPIVQSVNFKLVPTPYKPLYVAVAGFFWANIMCYIKSRIGERDEYVNGYFE